MPTGGWRARAPRIAGDAAVVLAVAAVLALAQAKGVRARVLAPEPGTVRAADAAEALEHWRRAGVRGRVLVHVARESGLVDAPGPAAAEGFVARAIDEGIVRRVLHVVPEADWPEVERNLRAFPAAAAEGPALRLTHRGAPVVVSRLRDLAPGDEPVLVDVDAGRFSEAELRELAARLRAGRPRADLVVVRGASAAPDLEGPGARAE